MKSLLTDPADRLRRAQAATGGVVGSPGYNTGIRANLSLAGRPWIPARSARGLPPGSTLRPGTDPVPDSAGFGMVTMSTQRGERQPLRTRLVFSAALIVIAAGERATAMNFV
ncbi:hypothetical protein Raf01_25490 [Rugosimonospora africana]|uniref:Uncharacterized protein n=1 Tax=Rugosimonospora africana TaxID=556532 RepID=A0A8J3QRD5_9ACTN|nr:hypothetical protein Raf01_25490 [Rugosimonospora africana]